MSEQFLQQIILPCLSTILLTLTTIFMTMLKKKVNQVANTKEKKEVVESVVNSVEYLYNKLDIHNKSKEKLALAKRDITKLLNDRNIKITEHELDILINSCLLQIETETRTTIDELRNDIYDMKKQENINYYNEFDNNRGNEEYVNNNYDFHINSDRMINYSYMNVKPKDERQL